jgi:hypothetical protein
MELKFARPFEPFFIELSSGRILQIPTPDHIIVSEGGAGRVVVLNDDGTFSAPSGLHHRSGRHRFRSRLNRRPTLTL